MEQKLYNAASKLPETALDFDAIQSTAKPKATKNLWRAASLAACMILLICLGFGTYAITAEAKEYREALAFFEEYDLPTEGLTRAQIKAVYRDITTESFTYSKTAEIILQSLTQEQVEGFEILQEDPTPEDVENLWNYKNYTGKFLLNGTASKDIHFEYEAEYHDPFKGKRTFVASHVRKYDGEKLLWEYTFDFFRIRGVKAVSDGVIAYGCAPSRIKGQDYGYILKLDENGELCWSRFWNNHFDYEYIQSVSEEADGGYLVITRGDNKYFCFSRYSADGNWMLTTKSETGEYHISKLVPFGDGYLAKRSNPMQGELAQIAILDRNGNITDIFEYKSEDSWYYITDFLAYEGKIYLSAYTIPRHPDDPENAGNNELQSVSEKIDRQNPDTYADDVLTPLIRDVYTAVLLICDPDDGTVQTFYTAKGSLGGELEINPFGVLTWNVESITSTFFSPGTSSFRFGGVCYVYEYGFDATGKLLYQYKNGEVVNFRKW